MTDFDRVRVGGNQLNPNYEVALTHFISGAITTGAKKFQWVIPFAATIVGVRARLDTAPTGATAILDVNINGTTAYSTQGNRPTIAIAGNNSTTTLPNTVAVAAGDRVSFDIDQIGSDTAGSDLTIAITLKRANVA